MIRKVAELEPKVAAAAVMEVASRVPLQGVNVQAAIEETRACDARRKCQARHEIEQEF